MIEIATEKAHKDNYKEKHNRDAKYGWYKYSSQFGFLDGSSYTADVLIRNDANGKKYLYDILEIKKETSRCFQE